MTIGLFDPDQISPTPPQIVFNGFGRFFLEGVQANQRLVVRFVGVAIADQVPQFSRR